MRGAATAGILSALAAAVTLLLACSRGTALDGSCEVAGGCPPGTRCVAATGFCVRVLAPPDPDGGSRDQD